MDMAKQLLEHWTNIYFGFTGAITFSSSRGTEKDGVIRLVPLNRLLLETDGPLYVNPPFFYIASFS